MSSFSTLDPSSNLLPLLENPNKTHSLSIDLRIGGLFAFEIRMDVPSNDVQLDGEDGGVQIRCFTQVVDEATLNFQIIRLHRQIYAWIGSNSTNFGHLYAAAPTRPNNLVSVTSILGGSSDNTGSGIARRLVLKTGLSIMLACNIPKNNPLLEANAEKRLVQELINLGYTREKLEGSP